jgi:hypothetical protein
MHCDFISASTSSSLQCSVMRKFKLLAIAIEALSRRSRRLLNQMVRICATHAPEHPADNDADSSAAALSDTSPQARAQRRAVASFDHFAAGLPAGNPSLSEPPLEGQLEGGKHAPNLPPTPGRGRFSLSAPHPLRNGATRTITSASAAVWRGFIRSVLEAIDAVNQFSVDNPAFLWKSATGFRDRIPRPSPYETTALVAISELVCEVSH